MTAAVEREFSYYHFFSFVFDVPPMEHSAKTERIEVCINHKGTSPWVTLSEEG
jgi:hypothetical protein